MLQSPDFCGVFQLGWCFQNFLEFVFLGNRTHDLFFFGKHYERTKKKKSLINSNILRKFCGKKVASTQLSCHGLIISNPLRK